MKKDKTNSPAISKSGVRLRSLSILMIILAVAVSLFFLDTTFKSVSAYTKMRTQNKKYVECQKNANALQTNFTEQLSQLQTFIKKGDKKYLSSYSRDTKETADTIADIQVIVREMRDSTVAQSFENVKATYSELKDKEYYAIALAANAYINNGNLTTEDLPSEVRSVTLSGEHLKLKDKEKINAAYDIISDEEYLGTLNELRDKIGYQLNNIISFTQEKQAESSDILVATLKKQMILNVVLLAMIVLFNLLTFALIIRPMQKAHSKIIENSKLPVSGSHEMQTLAERYNALYDLNVEQQKKLAHKASHDSLTGLKNRGVFEQLCKKPPKNRAGTISMLMIDIDKFKRINDTYGHNAGDDILRCVANRMKDAFSDIGYVCRIGGDEFAIVLKTETEQIYDLIMSRVSQLFESLPQNDESLPNVSLSVGVAFGAKGETGYDVYRRADASLYQAKTNNDKCSVKFFDDEEIIVAF